MQFLLTILVTMLFSYNLLAVELKSFEVYKKDLKLLQEDSKLISGSHPLKQQVEQLIANHSHINFGASPNGLRKKAQQMGWRNVEKRSAELAYVCGQIPRSSRSCLLTLEEFKQFIWTSNLNQSDKKIIRYFFERYEQKILAEDIINEEFIASFNINIKNFNLELNRKQRPEITVKVTPVKTSRFVSILEDSSTRFYSMIFFALILSGIVTFAVKRILAQRSQKRFAANLFKVARKNNMQLRIFGTINNNVMSAHKKIDFHLTSFFFKTKIISKNVKLKFKQEKKIIVIEALYDSQLSLQSELESEGSLLKGSFNVLANELEMLGGDIQLSTKFNYSGNVTETGFVIHIQS